MWSRIALAITCFVALPAVAGPVTLPWTFQPSTPAVASQVNDNFGAVATGVNGNAADIAALLAQIAALQGSVTALQSTVAAQGTTITTLQGDVTTLQGTVAAQLAAQLADPRPKDSRTIRRLDQYKGLAERWQNWTQVAAACQRVADVMLS